MIRFLCFFLYFFSLFIAFIQSQFIPQYKYRYYTELLEIEFNSPKNNSEIISKCFLLESDNKHAREISPKDIVRLALHFSLPLYYIRDENRAIFNSLIIDSSPVPELTCNFKKRYCELYAISFLTPSSLLGFQKIGEYINPGIIHWHNRLLLIGESTIGIPKNDTMHLRRLGFQWLNHSEFPFNDDDAYLGINSTNKDMTYLDDNLLGQDPRILILPNNSLLVLYTNHFTYLSHRNLRSASVIIYLDPNTNQLAYMNRFQSLDPDHHKTKDHKNFASFTHNDNIYIVENFNPFIISKIYSDYQRFSHKSNQSYYGKNLKTMVQHTQHLNWQYGTIRGGSNPILVDENRFLVFFHSHYVDKSHKIATYYMGAITFSNRPPFNLLAYTPYPIADELFYSGPHVKENIDYVVFPTGALMSKNGSLIYVSMGWQDRYGFLLTFSKSILLEHMKPAYSH